MSDETEPVTVELPDGAAINIDFPVGTSDEEKLRIASGFGERMASPEVQAELLRRQLAWFIDGEWLFDTPPPTRFRPGRGEGEPNR